MPVRSAFLVLATIHASLACAVGEEPPRSPPFSLEYLLKIFLRNIPDSGFPGLLQNLVKERGKDYAIKRINAIC